MKYLRAIGMMLSMAVAAAAVAPSDVSAKPAKEEAKQDPAAPTRVRRAPVLRPKGLRWGQTPKKVFRIYNKAIEHDFLPEYQKAQPGVQMERVDSEVRIKQEAFRHSFTKLNRGPSALDATPFEGEYTYYNKEAFARVERNGRQRTLFFIKNRLWKTIDVFPLGEGSKWGKTYEDAVKRVDRLLKKNGRRIPAAEGQRAMADWTDAKTYVQVVDWAPGEIAVVLASVRTIRRLGELRSNKGPEQHDIHPEVKGVLRNEGKAPTEKAPEKEPSDKGAE